MPDTPVDPPGGRRYPIEMETRVAILEHMAQTTAETLARIERRFDAVDRRFEAVDRRLDANFRCLFGVMLAGWGSVLGVLGAMFGLMAHGFHWF
ncbi:MAG: hypothetical protein ABI224_12790 [Acetobacteraceae bacterium]